ncbi:MAG: hypothetical protein JWM43_397 [Acidobacteriaceae bacterium]|nr:hypothetical protein [Acidobacteriaceae bacterium]
MRIVLAAVFGLGALTGCDSGQAKIQADERNFAEVGQAQQDKFQWRLDDAVAVGIFTESRYLTFRKCHEEPPAQPTNKKVCADLQTRVTNQEAKDAALARKEKAAW